MTKIQKTLKEQNDIINNLINKLDIANLGNWTAEKKEITDLLTYLRDKTQAKPTGANDIDIDLTEIEALETTLKNLTDENTRLTNENNDSKTKITEQDNIINDATIPNLISKLEQFAGKVSDGELKTTLGELKTQLNNLEKEQEETKTKVGDIERPNNYWGISTIIGICALFFIKLYEVVKKNKKELE